MMNPTLLRKLEDLDLDEIDSAFPFSKRLMRDNGWTASYALSVIDEYRRFVYLAMVSDKPVTPSDEVDQAWHLHLIYTRHYWEVFSKILPTPLHHEPTKGGDREQKKFSEQYQGTLDLYQKTFDEKPPADIWPDVETRFSSKYQSSPVTSENYWIIPKFSVGPIPAILFIMLAGMFTPIPFQLMFSLLAVLLIFLIFNRASKRKEKSNAGGGCGGGIGCGSGCGGCGG